MSLELALEWAADGHRVLPVNGNTKRPLIKAWQDAATTGPEQIRAWWLTNPDARVGVATGAPGCDVLDFDVAGGKPGLEQLEKLIDLGIIEPGTFRIAATPSGGRHLWFSGSEQRNKQNDKSVPGVDFRAVGGMVLVPGNPGYRWVAGSTLAKDDLKPVDWLAVASALVEPKPADQPVLPARPAPSRFKSPLSGGPNDAPGEESPLDWFCQHNDLNDLLRRDGWTYGYEQAGRHYWVRPGKDPKDGISGNVAINPDGRQTLINYSSTVDLPTDRGLSAAQYYAYREHGGDVRAAAGTIRRTLMPQQTRSAASPATQTAVSGMPVGVGQPGAPERTPGAELVPMGESGIPEPVREFWQRRPELREVMWQAQIGGVSPWAVLGNILAGVAGRVGPHVRLPALGGVGAAASLNILVAVSGNSGMGKGRSSSIGRAFLGSPRPPHRKPGTGQGIAAMFTVQTKDGPVQENDTVVLNVAEITQLGAHMSQQGATITSTLLEVYMGEELGEHYANKELRRPVRDGAYRLALVAGVQPDNSAILFDHAASGLPQRFLWLPAVWLDAILPESGLRPPAPGAELAPWRAWSGILPGSLDDSLDATGWSPTDAANGLTAPGGGKKQKEPEAIPAPVKEECLVEYAPGVARTIAGDHTRRLNAVKRRMLAGEDDPGDPDSHLLLTRIKVATLLACWLDHRAYISDEMWEMSAWPVWISNATRISAQGRIQAKNAEKSAGRAASTVLQMGMVKDDEERRHTAMYIRACDRLMHLVTTAGDWISRSGTTGLNKRMSSKEKRDYREAGVEVEDVLSDLVLAGKLEARDTERGGQVVAEWKTK